MVVVSADTRAAAARPPSAQAAPTVQKPDAAAPPTALADGDKPAAAEDRHHHRRHDRQAAGSARSAARRPAGDQGRTPSPRADAKPDAPIDQRLLETSRHGAIPKIAPDGARPSEIYARPVKPQAGRADQPRVAIVIEGLGIGANSTAEALAKLPAPVTFAFAPYGTDLERWVARARGEGHEVLLQIGMEPFDYPDNDPGPQTLLTSLSAEQNIDRLHWFLSRFQGYVGVTSLMGARFTATDQALAPDPARDRQARSDLFRRRHLAAQRRRPGRRRAATSRSPRPTRCSTPCRPPPRSTARSPASRRPRAAAASRSAPASALPVTIDRIVAMDQGGGCARHHAGADQRGREPGEVGELKRGEWRVANSEWRIARELR